jgi:uncharacterized lipoprotein YmbA
MKRDQSFLLLFLKKEEVFFSEEKKQKTFIPWRSLTACVFLAACSSPDPTYYALQTVTGTPINTPAGTVEVRRPGLAGYLDRSDIVLKSESYKLSLNSQQQWAEPLGDMIGRVLTQDLSQRLPEKSVFTQSGAITADADERVEVDIQAFDADGSGDVVLTAQVAVEQGMTHHPLTTRHVALRAPLNGPGAAAQVAAMSGLLGRLSDQIAGDLAGAQMAVLFSAGKAETIAHDAGAQ